MKRSGGSSGRASERAAKRSASAILAVARRAVAEAIELHRALGQPVAEWRDGHVVWVRASASRRRSR
jgi:hypothetical protein